MGEPRGPDCSQMLKQGLDFVQQATTNDNSGNYNEAIRLYQLGLESLISVLKYEQNERITKTLRGKVIEYMQRAEQLKGLASPAAATPAKASAAAAPRDTSGDLALPSPPAQLPSAPSDLPGEAPQPLPPQTSAGGGAAGGNGSRNNTPKPAAPVPPSLPSVQQQPPPQQTPSPAGGGAPTGSFAGSPPPAAAADVRPSGSARAGAVHLRQDQTGCSFAALFETYLRGATEVEVEVTELHVPARFFELLRLAELLVALGSARTLIVVTRPASSAELAATQQALLALKASLEERGVRLDAVANGELRDGAPRRLRTNTGWRLMLPRGLQIHQPPASPYGIGLFDLDLRRCLETTIEIYRDQ